MATQTSPVVWGARFFRCALQVNPYPYLERHGVQHNFRDETAYNVALVDSLVAVGVEVACVTDHYRVKTSESLVRQARAKGIHVFPGFEAVSKDGVHFLCIFDTPTPIDRLERYLGQLGIHDEAEASPIGKLDSEHLLAEMQRWGGVCIAAHIASAGGLLRTLSGQSRVNVWRNEALLACSLPGAPENAPAEYRDIVANRDPAYKRKWPVAVLNSQDISGPADAKSHSCSCMIKMTAPSVEALRQAFLDPESRVRLLHTVEPVRHYELLELTWEGGFLDNVKVQFSPHLNSLIGGRGTGKSSVIESLRAVLGVAPSAADSRKRHEEVLRSVIRPGTKITARVAVHRPQRVEYIVERLLPGDSIVRTSDNKKSKIRARDLIPGLEIYGQHEISELAGDTRALTALLARFLEDGIATDGDLQRLKSELQTSRAGILTLGNKLRGLEERLAALPRLEEQVKRFEEAGIAGVLKDQTAIIAEEGEFNELRALLEPIAALGEEITGHLPVNLDDTPLEALRASPLSGEVPHIETVIKTFSAAVKRSHSSLLKALDEATAGIDRIQAKHSARKKEVQKKTAGLLRQLGSGSADGQDYIRIKTQLSALQPLKPEGEKARVALAENVAKRDELLRQWAERKAAQFRSLEKAARRVSKLLAGSVRVSVVFQGDREPLWQALRKLGGRLAETIEALEAHDTLTPIGLAVRMRDGAQALRDVYGINLGAAERLAGAEPQVLMEIEEADLAHTTEVELNVATKDADPVWKKLSDLSAGQRATAVLLLLLLESPAPLVVDQPEDDLDNRFIYDSIVPRIRAEKRQRQFIFATHNANIPVLADAELVACFHAAGDGSEGRAELRADCVGSIDVPEVRKVIEQVLEGGAEAFEMRRKKYRY